MIRSITRRLVLPLLGSTLLLGAVAGSALGKCEGEDPPAFCDEAMATIDFGSSGASLGAGIESPVRLWLFRGEQPIDVSSVTLVFNRVSDQATVSIQGRPSGEPGLWLSDVELPAGGGWTVVAEFSAVDGIMERVPLDTLRVREPLAAPGDEPGTPVTPTAPAPPSVPALPIALLVAGIVAVALFVPSVRGRIRRGGSARPDTV